MMVEELHGKGNMYYIKCWENIKHDNHTTWDRFQFINMSIWQYSRCQVSGIQRVWYCRSVQQAHLTVPYMLDNMLGVRYMRLGYLTTCILAHDYWLGQRWSIWGPQLPNVISDVKIKTLDIDKIVSRLFYRIWLDNKFHFPCNKLGNISVNLASKLYKER